MRQTTTYTRKYVYCIYEPLLPPKISIYLSIYDNLWLFDDGEEDEDVADKADEDGEGEDDDRDDCVLIIHI